MAEDVGNMTVVHAHGIGGSGFEASWGIAGELLRLVEENRTTLIHLLETRFISIAQLSKFIPFGNQKLIGLNST